MTKLARTKQAGKQRVRRSLAPRAKAHDQRLLEQAAQEEAEAPTAIEAAPSTAAVESSIKVERTKRLAEDLLGLLTGNLYTDDGFGCSPAKALQRVAQAQLRAVRAAMCAWPEGDCMSAPLPVNDRERPGWEPADVFTKNDAIEALGGTIALLHFGPDLLDEAESVLAEPEAAAERDLAVLRQVADQRGAS